MAWNTLLHASGETRSRCVTQCGKRPTGRLWEILPASAMEMKQSQSSDVCLNCSIFSTEYISILMLLGFFMAVENRYELFFKACTSIKKATSYVV
jgi:hypothetical protein